MNYLGNLLLKQLHCSFWLWTSERASESLGSCVRSEPTTRASHRWIKGQRWAFLWAPTQHSSQSHFHFMLSLFYFLSFSPSGVESRGFSSPQQQSLWLSRFSPFGLWINTPTSLQHTIYIIHTPVSEVRFFLFTLWFSVDFLHLLIKLLYSWPSNRFLIINHRLYLFFYFGCGKLGVLASNFPKYRVWKDLWQETLLLHCVRWLELQVSFFNV